MSKDRTVQIAAYRGCGIQTAPFQLADSGKWEVNIRIFRDHGDEKGSREFSSANSFKARDEAVACCFYLGKQIIDRKIRNCNVDRL